MASFDLAFRRTMHHEAGYAKDPLDPGGETWRGISRHHWPDWEGWGRVDQAKADLGDVSIGELERVLWKDERLEGMVRSFYRREFWSRVSGDAIDQALAEELFDSAVNLGPERVGAWFQAALNVMNRREKLYPDLRVDGSIGPKTLEALRVYLTRDPDTFLILLLNVEQGHRYFERTMGDEKLERFIRGWLERVQLSKRGGLDGPASHRGN